VAFRELTHSAGFHLHLYFNRSVLPQPAQISDLALRYLRFLLFQKSVIHSGTPAGIPPSAANFCLIRHTNAKTLCVPRRFQPTSPSLLIRENQCFIRGLCSLPLSCNSCFSWFLILLVPALPGRQNLCFIRRLCLCLLIRAIRLIRGFLLSLLPISGPRFAHEQIFKTHLPFRHRPLFPNLVAFTKQPSCCTTKLLNLRR